MALVGVRDSPPSPNLRARQAICGSVGNARDPQYTSLACAAEVEVGVGVALQRNHTAAASFLLAGSGTVRCGGARLARGVVVVPQPAEASFSLSL